MLLLQRGVHRLATVCLRHVRSRLVPLLFPEKAGPIRLRQTRRNFGLKNFATAGRDCPQRSPELFGTKSLRPREREYEDCRSVAGCDLAIRQSRRCEPGRSGTEARSSALRASRSRFPRYGLRLDVQQTWLYPKRVPRPRDEAERSPGLPGHAEEFPIVKHSWGQRCRWPKQSRSLWQSSLEIQCRLFALVCRRQCEGSESQSCSGDDPLPSV